MRWADLSGFERDLVISVGAVNVDPDREPSGVVIIDDVRERFGHEKEPEWYYVALKNLAERGWLDVEKRGRKKIHELSASGAKQMLHQRHAIDGAWTEPEAVRA